jgi:hypothetical protein
MTPGISESQREPLQQRGPFWTPITPHRGSFFHADSQISGKSDLAKAIRYTLAQWGVLTRVLRDGRACLHNNAAEGRMRPLALGWKNYLFAGSLEGGRRAAIIYTLVGTAELNGWDPQAYLRLLLRRIADQGLSEGTPKRYDFDARLIE